MKLSIFAAFAALFTTSVVTMPAPDPSHWEVVLSLDDMNAEDQPIRIAQPSSTSSSTVLPTPTTTQEVQVFLFTLPTPPPNVFSIPIPVPLDGKPIPLSKSKLFSKAFASNPSSRPNLSASLLEVCTTIHHSRGLVSLTPINIFSRCARHHLSPCHLRSCCLLQFLHRNR